MYKNILVTLILTSVILTSCDLNAGVTSVSLQETAAAITETTLDEVYMNNCGGKGDVKQTSERKKSVTVDMSGNFGIDPIVLQGEVSTKYSQVNEASKSIELTAPPGTKMVFFLEWTETSWLGVATSIGKEGQATYRVSVPISVSLVSSRDLGCENTPVPPSVQSSSTGIYDDFNNPLASSNLWKRIQDENCDIKQENGVATFSLNNLSANSTLCYLELPNYVQFDKVGSFAAKLLAKNDASGDRSLQILEFKTTGFTPDTDWIAQCGIIRTPNANQNELFLYVDNSFPNGQEIYKTLPATTEEFYNMRLELDPTTGLITCYANDNIVGSYTPTNLNTLKSQLFNRHFVGFWSPQSAGTYQVDDAIVQP